MLGHYDDRDGRWYWITSGQLSFSEGVWCDFIDDYVKGLYSQKPTHWKPLDPPPTK